MDDSPGVQVSVAPSTIAGADLELFHMRGFASDGPAPKGTRLAKYEGRCFVTAANIARIESSEYHSDYLWGKLHPLTHEYTIADAVDLKSCYTRYVNEGFFYSNCEVVLGTDGVLYSTMTTDVFLNEELTMPYGAAFWTFPERWMSLPQFLQEAVLQFCDCVPPQVLALGVAKKEVVRQDGHTLNPVLVRLFVSIKQGMGHVKGRCCLVGVPGKDLLKMQRKAGNLFCLLTRCYLLKLVIACGRPFRCYNYRLWLRVMHHLHCVLMVLVGGLGLGFVSSLS